MHTLVNCTPLSLCLREITLVLIEKEALWVPLPVWTFWKYEKYLTPYRDLNPWLSISWPGHRTDCGIPDPTSGRVSSGIRPCVHWYICIRTAAAFFRVVWDVWKWVVPSPKRWGLYTSAQGVIGNTEIPTDITVRFSNQKIRNYLCW